MVLQSSLPALRLRYERAARGAHRHATAWQPHQACCAAGLVLGEGNGCGSHALGGLSVRLPGVRANVSGTCCCLCTSAACMQEQEGTREHGHGRAPCRCSCGRPRCFFTLQSAHVTTPGSVLHHPATSASASVGRAAGQRTALPLTGSS